MPSHYHTNQLSNGYGAPSGQIHQAAIDGLQVAYYDYTQYTGGDGAHNNLPPYVLVAQIIKVAGVQVSTVYDSDQIGTVKSFTGKTIPTNWVLADGASYTKAAQAQGWAFAKQEADAGNPLWTYTATAFTVPNLTDKFILAPGANTIGQTGGEKDHILIPAETAMKGHGHTASAGTDSP